MTCMEGGLDLYVYIGRVSSLSTGIELVQGSIGVDSLRFTPFDRGSAPKVEARGKRGE